MVEKPKNLLFYRPFLSTGDVDKTGDFHRESIKFS